jgi:hypothetical protein
VAVRGLTPLVLFAVLAVARAAAGEPSPEARDLRIDAVRVADQPDGSIVTVKLHGRSRLRLLRSVEHLAAIVIADVDADGDLDILASTIRQGLLLWRNAGRGHFVLARLPRARDALGGVPRASHDTHANRYDEPGEGSADSAVPRTEGASDPLVLRSSVLLESFSVLVQYRVAPSGRAPPSIA